MKQSHLGSVAVYRDGGLVSCVRNSSLSAGIFRTISGWVMLPSMCSMISLLLSNGFPSMKPLLTLLGARTFSVHRRAVRRRVRAELGLPISIGVARTKHLAKIASQVAKPDGLVVVDPETELDFLHDLPVELMWGVGPVTRARLAEIGVHTIGQLAKMPGYSLERLLGRAAGEKLTALAWNRDPRQIRTHHRAQSAGAQSALGKKPAEEQVFRPTLRHLADRIASRLRAKSRPGRTVTVRVRFADLHSVTRSVTLDAPISATATLAEIAEELVRTALSDHPKEKTISLLAISMSHLEKHWKVQLELPLGLEDEKRNRHRERDGALDGRPRC